MKNGKGPAATYLYCLVKSKSRPSLAGVPRGLQGMGAPRLLDAGDSLWLVGSDAPLARYDKASIDARLQDLDWVASCAVAHEKVIEYFTGSRTVIPMKLFTLFTNDDRALAHIRELREDLDETILRVSGCREWGVRISLNNARAMQSARETTKLRKTKETSISPGTQFLRLRKKEQDIARELKARAQSEAESAYQKLAECGSDALRLPAVQSEGNSRIILDAAFLVPQRKEKRFRDTVQRLTDRLAQSYNVSLSGPWPPYNFVARAR